MTTPSRPGSARDAQLMARAQAWVIEAILSTTTLFIGLLLVAISPARRWNTQAAPAAWKSQRIRSGPLTD